MLLGLPEHAGDIVQSAPLALWRRQAQLPLRYGGCGLRSSVRTAPAAYWGSWADCFGPLSERFPAFGRFAMQHLSAAEAGFDLHLLPASLAAVHEAGLHLQHAGFRRPAWENLLRGERPPPPGRTGDPRSTEACIGEWVHGWQFHASDVLEQQEHVSLLTALSSHGRFRGQRAPPPGPARLRSCAGPHAASWLTATPSTAALQLDNVAFSCGLRRRLGLATGSTDYACEGCGAALDPFGFHRCACTRSGRHNARHFGVLQAWRQVFQESGNSIPRRNVERLLRNTHVPCDRRDARRLDLIVAGSSIARGLPLFCDVTVVSPISANGRARGGCTRADGGALDAARRVNNRTYSEVSTSGVARLCALDVETFGRWGADPLWIVPALARERTRGLPTAVRAGTRARLSHRWWSLLSAAVQRQVAAECMRTAGADLGVDVGEPAPCFAELPAVP